MAVIINKNVNRIFEDDDLKRIFLMSGIFKIIPMKEEEKLNG